MSNPTLPAIHASHSGCWLRDHVVTEDGQGWQITWRDEIKVKPGQKISQKRLDEAPVHALGFTLDEVRALLGLAAGAPLHGTPYALVAGALPPLMGWTAVTNGLEAPGLVLFSILFLWQVPHFIAISIFRSVGRANITHAEQHPTLGAEPRMRQLLVLDAAEPAGVEPAGKGHLEFVTRFARVES